MKRLTTLFLALCAVLNGYAQPKPDQLKNIKFRPIGPANMGGRVTDIVGIPGDPSTFYFGAADGGLFKTTNGGVTFESLFDHQRTLSVGAIGMSENDPEVIYIGTGEGDPRNSTSYGNGVYRSLDGGKSWKHIGLSKTERIKRIIVHPTNADVACVCALGREWGPNTERGVFQTKDGGKTWNRILYLDENTGCSDLTFELKNPRIMYAGMWTFLRRPWRFDDGGKSTAVYRSKDGGETWDKIMKGLPNGPMARIGLAVAQSEPNVVYLITEFPKQAGSLFRSEDRGDNWTVVNKDPNINFRPFYYSDIRVDPNNHNVVYSLSGPLLKSEDGGKNFAMIARDVHGDHQALWLDPKNSKRILSGSDGGYQLSFDAGKTWDIINNVELSQFYQMDIDNLDPYNIYGGLQDNGTWMGPSNSLLSAGIMKRHWKGLAGGDGYYAVPIPGSEHEIYANLQGGVIFHVNTKTGDTRTIHPYPKITGSAGDAIQDHKYRFNWDSPIHISPHDPNTVYFGGNVLFASSDRGYNWKELSADLTTNDKSKQTTSGGEVYQDNTAAEFHCTILTIAESPKEKGVIWCGTDDGNVQLTRDGGKTWTKLNSAMIGLPAFSWIGKIHASEHNAGTALVIADNHRSDDFKPYVFLTTDYGKTWSKITNGLQQDDYVKVARQDPHNPNMIYVGMECGLYASWDMGKNFVRINNNLPPVSVTDLRIHPREHDLIVATHGRGIWIADDIRGLQEWNDGATKDVHVFPVKQATQWKMYTQLENLGSRVYAADNPTYGAYINYYLQVDAKSAVTVDITNSKNDKVKTLTDTTAKAGLNRLVWDLRHSGPTPLERNLAGGFFGGGSFGPLATPGMYTATLKANGKTIAVPIEVRPDPRSSTVSKEDYSAKEEATLAAREQLSSINNMINETEALIDQLTALKKRRKEDGATADGKPDETAKKVDAALKELGGVLDALRRPPPRMNYRQRPELREEITSLLFSMDGPNAKPTTAQTKRIDQIREEKKVVADKLAEVIEKQIKPLNAELNDLPQIVPRKVKP